MRDRQDIEQTMKSHANTVMRVCTLYFSNQADRDDAFQDTFIKYAQAETSFNDAEHKKAWLIRVAKNTCKDMLKAAHTKNAPLDEIDEAILEDKAAIERAEKNEGAELLTQALRKLDVDYRNVLYLKYYEGYTAAEIASILKMPENTVYTKLSRGREKLKEVLTRGEQTN